MSDKEWTRAERNVARIAFNKALKREYDLVILKIRKMAADASEPSDVWEIHRYLSLNLKEIDRKYDYRYSIITTVFGRLLAEGLISERDLEGLKGDKTEAIRRMARAITEM